MEGKRTNFDVMYYNITSKFVLFSIFRSFVSYQCGSYPWREESKGVRDLFSLVVGSCAVWLQLILPTERCRPRGNAISKE